MERLTFEGSFCDIAQCRELPCPYDGSCTQKEVWQRLKAYEDAGLSPQACAEAREIEETLSGCDYSISRMVELMKADVEGRVVILPCKVGDVIYKLFREYTECTSYQVRKDNYCCEGCMVPCDSREVTVIRAIQPNSLPEVVRYIKDIGRTVFLTREEAEKALRETQEKEDADGTTDKPE